MPKGRPEKDRVPVVIVVGFVAPMCLKLLNQAGFAAVLAETQNEACKAIKNTGYIVIGVITENFVMKEWDGVIRFDESWLRAATHSGNNWLNRLHRLSQVEGVPIAVIRCYDKVPEFEGTNVNVIYCNKSDSPEMRAWIQALQKSAE